MGDLEPGDHLGCVHETDAESQAAFSACVGDGLTRGEKVLYVAEAGAVDVAIGSLRDRGLDPDACVERAQLCAVVGDRDGRRAVTTPDQLIERITEETAQAEAQGFAGLRLVQDMACLTPDSDASWLVEYERRLGEWLLAARCTALCQYDRRRFDGDALLRVLHLHPAIVIGGEPHDNPDWSPAVLRPAERLTRWIDAVTAHGAAARTAADALEEREEQLRFGFAHGLDAVLLTTADGRILSANWAACGLFGRTPDDLCGLGERGVLDLADDDRLPALLEERRRAGASAGEVRFRRKDGTVVHGAVAVGTFFDQTGADRTSLVVRDITGRKIADAQRAAVAHDLKDDLTQRLTTVKWQLEAMRLGRTLHTATRRRLDKIIGLLGGTLRALWQIADDLDPSIVSDLGLPAALEQEARDFEARTAIPCTLATDIGSIDIDPPAARVLFGLCRETLRDIARRTGEAEVTIRLEADRGGVVLVVEDARRGIPGQDVGRRPSRGLLEMRERALAFGAQVDIRRGGAGTTVSARWPRAA
jgi:PAS domain S-box-containing protein